MADISDVTSNVAEREAGQFAERRFRARRRVWLRRIWWAFPVVILFEIAVTAGLGLLLSPGNMGFYLGLGIGAGLGAVLVLADSPPHHIERWRQGAAGDRATAKALRPLTRGGWTLLHDIDTGRGNIDHVVVGPPGVFLLETKNLNGVVSVERGVMSVRWREDPGDGYEQWRLAPRVRAAAADLAGLLQAHGLCRIWVQPVVVLWAQFEQRSIESQGVAWVRGKDLAHTLRHRPTTLSHEDIVEVTAALHAQLPAPRDPSRRRAPIGTRRSPRAFNDIRRAARR